MNTKQVFDFLSEDIKQNLYKQEYQSIINKASLHNKWFIPQFIIKAIYNLTYLIDTIQEEPLLLSYNYNFPKKNILIIAAGNIPCVCFHDIMCTLLTGNKATIKLSSKDDILIPFLLSRIETQYPQIKDYIEYIKTPTKTNIYDGIIATGSNSSATLFDYYFSSRPHIIRSNRHSVAIIKDNEDINGLEDDICLYFGLGCRNISHLFLPKGYNLLDLKEKLSKYNYLLDNNTYRNNFDYQKAIMTMNNIPYTIFSPILLRETEDLFSPISVLNYSFYENIEDLYILLKKEEDSIQIILQNKFGDGQSPSFTCYADGINTIKWLQEIE